MFTDPIIASPTALLQEALPCEHCGAACDGMDIVIGDKYFCCNGCRTVFEILQTHGLCTYYDIDAKHPGISPADQKFSRKYEFLDDESVASQLIEFTDDSISIVTFHIPSMHCSSCIWLLEKLNAIHPAVLKSQVNFPRKEVTVTFRHSDLSLRGLFILLTSIGYEPLINLRSIAEKRKTSTDKQLYYRIGVAGFSFGNIMLLSFPEYLSSANSLEPVFRFFFGYLNVLLALPVFFYSAVEYFSAAWKGLRQRTLTIDLPLSIGIIFLFGRSLYEIFTHTGAGFLDSFTGLVFFLLIGKIFQKKTYDALSFDRDFRSYFPLSVTVIENGNETTIPLPKLKIGDRIVVRNQELIPADSILLREDARIDYSFVTGEADHISKKSGDLIFAGGKQVGKTIELEVVKETSQSYLTRLWNNDVFTKPAAKTLELFVQRVSKRFTLGVLFIAFASAVAWSFINPALVTTVFTAVLIVACPCALALSSPFALGTAQRVFGNNQFYIKNIETVEALARVDTLVFDKTGTLTQAGRASMEFVGESLSERSLDRIRSVVRHSTHTLSRKIHASIQADDHLPVSSFEEIPGKGIRAVVDGAVVRIGSREWTGATPAEDDVNTALVYVSADGSPLGYFRIESAYRKGLSGLMSDLRRRYHSIVLSGDSNREEEALRTLTSHDIPMYFNQSPEEKLHFIQALHQDGKRVLMLGDGLNDAGALQAADVGIAITEDINTFSPACDAILSARQFPRLHTFLEYARRSVSIVHASFVISLLYNVVGLGFAVTGRLSPLVSAILMPVSSVTAVAFTTILSRWQARRLGLN